MNNGAVNNFIAKNLEMWIIFRIFKGGWEADNLRLIERVENPG